MNETQRVGVVLEVIAGDGVEQVAARHGLTAHEVAAWRGLYVAGLRQAASASTRRGRARAGVLLAAAMAVVTFTGTWATAQSMCTQSLPSPLVTFCQDTPALAGEVNGNFGQLVTWLQQKVGTVGSSNVAVGGTLAVTGATSVAGLTATSAQINGAANITGDAGIGGNATVAGFLSSGRWQPAYQNWNGGAGTVGSGGAAIANDNGTYQALMVVGNESAVAGVRRVRMWDDVSVERHLRINGQLTFADSQVGYSTKEPGRNTSWGSWGGMSYCEANTYVCGMELLSEASQGGGDDTGVNGVRFACCTFGQ